MVATTAYYERAPRPSAFSARTLAHLALWASAILTRFQATDSGWIRGWHQTCRGAVVVNHRRR
jgi:hypothetical protein